MAQQKALIIVDIQNDYFVGGNYPLVGAEDASLNAKLILEDFRQKELPVIHIQHIATSPEAVFFQPNTQGADIHPNVLPLTEEKVIVKHYPNSFRETDLLDYLKDINVSELVICGMMTSMCVDATTRAAKDLGFTCVLIGDACAAPNLEYGGKTIPGEDVNTALLAALSYFYADVKSAKDYLRTDK